MFIIRSIQIRQEKKIDLICKSLGIDVPENLKLPDEREINKLKGKKKRDKKKRDKSFDGKMDEMRKLYPKRDSEGNPVS